MGKVFFPSRGWRHSLPCLTGKGLLHVGIGISFPGPVCIRWSVNTDVGYTHFQCVDPGTSLRAAQRPAVGCAFLNSRIAGQDWSDGQGRLLEIGRWRPETESLAIDECSPNCVVSCKLVCQVGGPRMLLIGEEQNSCATTFPLRWPAKENDTPAKKY
jgi:hypothetical protein